MVNLRAIKTALLVSGGLFSILFVGMVWRFVSRFVSFAALALFVVLAGYIAYELHAGWARGAADGSSGDSLSTDGDVHADDIDGSNRPDALSDSELDRELERLKEQRATSSPDGCVETDH